MKALIKAILGNRRASVDEVKSESDSHQACQALMHRPYDSIRAVPGISHGDSRVDIASIQRIIAAYAASTACSTVSATAIWEMIANSQQAPLRQILMSGDPRAVTALLSRPGDSNLLFGIDNLYSGAANSFKASPDIEMGHAKLCQDHLIRLAELTGAIRFWNPESPRNDAGFDKSADDLLVMIEKVIGYPISVPNPYPDESGIQTNRGIVSYRAIHAIYQAWRIQVLLKGIPNPRVLEIGGGLGRTAYYSRQFGVSDYTIIDLPFTGVSQAYFLMQTVGEYQVCLQGEAGKEGFEKIKLLNPDSFLNEFRRYDLIINVDSLTEMDRPTAERYVEKIEGLAPMFLSINHEANDFTVKELFDRSIRTRSSSRCEYGLRHGYVEEVYNF